MFNFKIAVAMAGAIGLAAIGAAHAADLIVPERKIPSRTAPPPAPEPYYIPTFNRFTLYGGLIVGATNINPKLSPFKDGTGFSGGLVLGGDYRFHQNWSVGLEGQIGFIGGLGGGGDMFDTVTRDVRANLCGACAPGTGPVIGSEVFRAKVDGAVYTVRPQFTYHFNQNWSVSPGWEFVWGDLKATQTRSLFGGALVTVQPFKADLFLHGPTAKVSYKPTDNVELYARGTYLMGETLSARRVGTNLPPVKGTKEADGWALSLGANYRFNWQ